MKLSWLWRHPTADEVVDHEHRTAQREIQHHALRAEYHVAMREMLKARINRLAAQIERRKNET